MAYVIEAVGMLIASVGLWMIYPPVALIVVGIVLVAAAQAFADKGGRA